MTSDLLSVKEVAHRLGVSRRRVEELVRRENLRARKVGNQWVISSEDILVFDHNRSKAAGRPLSQSSAWELIRSFENGSANIARDDLDEHRRRLRSRARHIDAYAHPGVLPRVRNDGRAVLGGRDAAVHIGAPVDPLEILDVYLCQSDYLGVVSEYGMRTNQGAANVRLHVVVDEAWPFSQDDHFVGRWVCWLDLADSQDRAAALILTRHTSHSVYA